MLPERFDRLDLRRSAIREQLTRTDNPPARRPCGEVAHRRRFAPRVMCSDKLPRQLRIGAMVLSNSFDPESLSLLRADLLRRFRKLDGFSVVAPNNELCNLPTKHAEVVREAAPTPCVRHDLAVTEPRTALKEVGRSRKNFSLDIGFEVDEEQVAVV